LLWTDVGSGNATTTTQVLVDWYVNLWPSFLVALAHSFGTSRTWDGFGIWVEPKWLIPTAISIETFPTGRCTLKAFRGLKDAERSLCSTWRVTMCVITCFIGSMTRYPRMTSPSLKWDYNRNFTETGDGRKLPPRTENVWYGSRRMFMTLFDRLRQKASNFRNSSLVSGAADAVDPRTSLRGRSYRFWPSGHTEAFDRLTIQQGFTYAYTTHVMVDWVTTFLTSTDGQRATPVPFSVMQCRDSLGSGGSNLNRWTTGEFTWPKLMICLLQYPLKVQLFQNGSLYRLALALQGNFSAEPICFFSRQVAVRGLCFLTLSQFAANGLAPARKRP